MSGVIDALFLDEFRQPSLGLRLCDLVGICDCHCTSGPLHLARHIDAIPADVLGAHNTNGTSLSGSAVHASPIPLTRHPNRAYISEFRVREQCLVGRMLV